MVVFRVFLLISQPFSSSSTFELLGFTFELITLCYDWSLSFLLILHAFGLSNRANLVD